MGRAGPKAQTPDSKPQAGTRYARFVMSLRDDLDGLDPGERLGALGPELGELARPGKHRALERTDGGVVGTRGRLQRMANPVEMLDEGRNSIVELPAKLADLLRVLRHGLLAPAVGRGLQQGHQRRRRDGQHAAADGAVEQRRVRFERCGEELVARQEKDDEFRRGLELLPVGLRAQRIDVAAHLGGMFRELRRAQLRIGG